MFLGIDLGTSGVKVLLMDWAQTVSCWASAPLIVARPHNGWAEQDPADWIAATRAALRQLAAAHDLSSVAGIGLSGQMHGAVSINLSDAVIPLRYCETITEGMPRRRGWTPTLCFARSSEIASFPALPRPRWSGWPQRPAGFDAGGDRGRRF